MLVGMAGCNKRKRLNDDELSELLNREISDSESECSGESDVQIGTWSTIGAERPPFPFSGHSGLNVGIQDPSNPLEFFCHILFYFCLRV